MAEQHPVEANFPLFSAKPPHVAADNHLFTKHTPSNPNPNTSSHTFSTLGLSDFIIKTCNELGMKKPTPVQQHCVPRILAGDDVLAIAQTGSGKTAAFALPILHRLAENPYGVYCLVMTPTRELAYQLAEQFKALGACLNLKCAVIVGGMDMITQSQTLMKRPHVVIATPGRIEVLIEQNPDIRTVFSDTKFLVLDEADKVLDAGFVDDLRVIINCLPENRQTLLFSATMTRNLQSLLEVSENKPYFYEGCESQVAISVEDVAVSPSPSVTDPEISMYAHTLVLMYTFFASLLPSVRRGIITQNDKKPPVFGFMANDVLLWFSGVTLCVTILVTVVLICGKYFKFSWMKDIHYTILKCIGYCSIVVGPFLLLMVITIPVKLSWIGFLVACVIIGTVIACFHSTYDPRRFNQEKIYPVTYSGFLLVPVLFVLVIILPNNLNWIVWMVYGLIFLLNCLYWLISGVIGG